MTEDATAAVGDGMPTPTFFDVIREPGPRPPSAATTLVLAESTDTPATEMTVARRMLGTVDGLILASPRLESVKPTLEGGRKLARARTT